MIGRPFVPLAVAAGLLFGCATSAQMTMQMPPPSPRILSKTEPPAQNPENCDAMEGKTCVIDLNVTVTSGVCTVSMKEYVKVPGDEKDVKFVEFRPQAGYWFCPRSGDGVFFFKPDAGLDAFDLDGHGKCDTSFFWKRNKKDSADYSFVVRFRSRDDKVQCVKDPWIRNG